MQNNQVSDKFLLSTIAANESNALEPFGAWLRKWLAQIKVKQARADLKLLV